jgi:hypothetical protein
VLVKTVRASKGRNNSFIEPLGCLRRGSASGRLKSVRVLVQAVRVLVEAEIACRGRENACRGRDSVY